MFALFFRLAGLPGRIVRAVVRAIDALVDALHWQWVRRHRPPLLRYRGRPGGLQVGPQTEKLFEAWRELVNEPYDPEIHDALLRRLWVASSFPEEEFSVTSLRWTQIGFQSQDPASDFRGGGALSLKCIVYMAETYNDVYRRLSKERPLEAYYPFCASFVNVSFALLDVLGVRNLGADFGRQPIENRCTYGFINLVVLHGDGHGDGHGEARDHPVELAFKEVAVQAMIDLDQTFTAEGAAYMDFPRVRGMVLDALADRMGRRSFPSSRPLCARLLKRGGSSSKVNSKEKI